jgi:hypothetical protein
MQGHKAVVLMNQLSSMFSSLARGDGRRYVPVVVYLGVVLSSLLVGLKRAPGTALITVGGVTLLVVLAALAYAVKYAARAALFYVIARLRHRDVAVRGIVAGVVICGAPEIALLCFSILLPGFDVVDQRVQMAHPVTSVTFYLLGLNLTPTTLHILGVVEGFNLLSLVLLTFLLRAVSGLRVFPSFIVNVVFDLAVQLIPR